MIINKWVWLSRWAGDIVRDCVRKCANVVAWVDDETLRMCDFNTCRVRTRDYMQLYGIREDFNSMIACHWIHFLFVFAPDATASTSSYYYYHSTPASKWKSSQRFITALILFTLRFYSRPYCRRKTYSICKRKSSHGDIDSSAVQYVDSMHA